MDESGGFGMFAVALVLNQLSEPEDALRYSNLLDLTESKANNM